MSNLLGYKDLPFEILNQINNVIDIWKRHLGDNLTGVYLHGSIAFNPDSGDIDILVVVKDSVEVATKLEIAKDKTAVIVKDTIPDEKVEILRDNCTNLRDRAMIDFLLSTGIRVGELVRLNIDDIDFSERECVVYGKGDKERKAYFDAKTKIHLLNYIDSRTDSNEALFVSLNKPHSRLTESGVELRLREMGKKLGVEKVHPHKFRRTMATRAIEKGMPIEQVQKILGHEQIDTTLRYAMVNQNNVKLSHRKYIS